MLRRTLLALLASTSFFAATFLVSPAVWSGSYLNRAALLLEQSRDERDMVLPRPNDKELIVLVHGVAQARARYGRKMNVPKVVAHAHPHLLLVLENSERAYAAALDGDHQRFLQHILRARTEDKTFRALIERTGYSLPPI